MTTAAEILQGAGYDHDPPILGPYIPGGGLTLLVGPEGAGKSSWLSDVAVSVASGTCPPWASSVIHGSVLWLTAEESLGVVAQGFKRSGACDLALANLHVEPAAGVDRERLLERIHALKPALVVADPIDVLLPPQKVPSRDDPLFLDCRAHGYGLVAVLHSLHGARPTTKIAKGSGDWTRLARSVLYFGPDPRHDPLSPNRRALLFHWKANRGVTRGEGQEFSEHDGWLGTVPNLTIDHLFARPEKTAAPGTAMARAIQLLRELLHAGARLSASEIRARADAIRISLSTLDRAANALGVKRTVARDDQGKIVAHWWSMERPQRPENVVQRTTPDFDDDDDDLDGYGIDDADGGGENRWLRRGEYGFDV